MDNVVAPGIEDTLAQFAGMVVKTLTPEKLHSEFASVARIMEFVRAPGEGVSDELMAEAQAKLDALAHGRPLL